MKKLLSLAAIAAVATLAIPIAAQPAAARDHHRGHGWKNVCKVQWDRHHHRRTRVCHRVRW